MPSISALGRLAEALFGELLASSGCAACDVPVSRHVLFCPPCAASVERGRARTLATFEYGGAIAHAIARLKYEDRPDLAPRLGRAMIPLAIALAPGADVIVPVPLHPRRLAERGYNQAALLACPLARAIGLPLATRNLVRLRDTPRQTALDRADRLVNLRDAFSARPSSTHGARVLLVDDVRTTGATLEGCVRALRDAGARAVIPLVLARRA